MPVTCATCGGKIKLSKDSYQSHVEKPYAQPPVTIYWHASCEPPWKLGKRRLHR